MAKSSAERASGFKQRMRKDGWKQKAIWIDGEIEAMIDSLVEDTGEKRQQIIYEALIDGLEDMLKKAER